MPDSAIWNHTGTAVAVIPVARRLARDEVGDPGPALDRLRRGAGDPTHRRVGDQYWRAVRTPEGPGLLRIGTEQPAADELVATAWGPGAEWLIEQAPTLLGALDDPTDFHPEHPLLASAHRHHPNFRVGRTDRVLEAFVPACLEQRVTGSEAYGAYAALVGRYGEAAPGPAQRADHSASGMRVPPDPAGWLAIPGWEYLRAGVEQARVRPLLAGAARAGALERSVAASAPGAALRSLPGVGEWTSAEVRQRAHGDADAWSRGDYHVGGMITLALAGEKLDDDACDELLAPYAGHRYRVQMLIAMTVGLPERHGPRRSLPTHLPLRRRRR